MAVVFFVLRHGAWQQVVCFSSIVSVIHETFASDAQSRLLRWCAQAERKARIEYRLPRASCYVYRPEKTLHA